MDGVNTRDAQLEIRYRVNANEGVFNRWMLLAERVMRMAAIVQNDGTVTETDLDDYYERCSIIKSNIDELQDATFKCISEVEG